MKSIHGSSKPVTAAAAGQVEAFAPPVDGAPGYRWIGELVNAGQTAGIGADAAILVIPRKCVPPGVGHVHVVAGSFRTGPGVNKAPKRERLKQAFFLNFWSQCRVAVVVAFSFGMPLYLADYSGAPPIPNRPLKSLNLEIVDQAARKTEILPIAKRSAALQAPSQGEAKGGSWLGWSIWGNCSKPQKAFDPGSEDTIESFGNYSRNYKVAHDKERLVNCIAGVFGTKCSQDIGYAKAAVQQIDNSSQAAVRTFAQG